MLRVSFRFLLMLAFAVGMTACDSGSDDDDGNGGGGGGGGNGSTNVTITGDLEGGGFSGNAIYVTAQDVGEEEDGWLIFLSEGAFDPSGGLGGAFRGIYIVGVGTLSEGSSSLTEDGTTTAFYMNFSSQTSFLGATATSGTVQITSISDNQVRGSIDFTGRTYNSLQPDQEGTASVQASFTAVRYSGFFPIISP